MFVLRYLSFFLSVVMFSSVLLGDESQNKREADLEVLLDRLLPSRSPATGRINAVDRTWEEWVERSGELPPDFDSMLSQSLLPDPLVLVDGDKKTPIETPEQWETQRQWIRSQIEQWVFGSMPPAPENLRVASSEETDEGDVIVRDVLLEFGPDHQAKLHLQLMIPKGEGPFPVFLTNQSRQYTFWVQSAVSRGYIACYYQATDPKYGLPDDSDSYIEIYPEYDFSALARWAWAASRAVDYLVTRPEVIHDQIGLTGHSRNGKQALLAAAFDTRIAAVAPASGLTGEVHPWRFTSDPYVVESIELLTGAQPHWFHPRLRFFAGREHKLPVDQNMLMALVAPRGLMVYSAFSEASANAFSIEQAYRSAREVYRFHEAEENVWLHLREGEHMLEVVDIENILDFFDTIFQRQDFPKAETWIVGYSFEDWKKTTGIEVDVYEFPIREKQKFETPSDLAEAGKQALEGIDWVLGEAPPVLEPLLESSFKENKPPARNPLELVFGRPEANSQWREQLAKQGMGSSGFSYGPGLNADIFYPLDENGKRVSEKLPVVIWLHPHARAVGWSAKLPWNPRRPDFIRDQRPDFADLTRRGFAVVAFDQIGYGGRTHEAPNFYKRYPNWSLMGKMVADTRSVIDAVSALEEIDASRIHLLGYSLGAQVGLFTAALDERVHELIAVSGIYPMRADFPEGETEGVRQFSHLHGLLPKLGFFEGEEARIPFDFDEILSLIAPRKVLVVAPKLDRFNPVDEVQILVENAREAYQLQGHPENLELWTPEDFNRFPAYLQKQVFEHLGETHP